MIEATRDITADLDVLDLILAHRNQVRIVSKYVGSLQDRVGEQPKTCGQPFRNLVLESNASLHQAHWGSRGKNPIQFRDFRDV